MISDYKEYDILVIEDNPGDFTLIEDFLFEQIATPRIVNVTSFHTAKAVLAEQEFDVILLDLSLPDLTGEALIRQMIDISRNIPVIVLTGYADFSFGVKSLSIGVSDYMLKDELNAMSLYKSIVYSLERKAATAALEESEKNYSELFHLSPIPMWVLNADTLKVLNVNNAAVSHYGFSIDEFLTLSARDIIFSSERKLDNVHNQDFKNALSHGIFTSIKKNKEFIQVETLCSNIQYEGKTACLLLANDVTERQNYIDAIVKQNERLKEISWIQSHIVRAPLSRIMGLITMLKDMPENAKEKSTVLDYITTSANELDDVIRKITDKSRVEDYEALTREFNRN